MQKRFDVTQHADLCNNLIEALRKGTADTGQTKQTTLGLRDYKKNLLLEGARLTLMLMLQALFSSISSLCKSANLESPIAFCVSLRSSVGLSLANSTTLSCGRNCISFLISTVTLQGTEALLTLQAYMSLHGVETATTLSHTWQRLSSCTFRSFIFCLTSFMAQVAPAHLT